VTTGFFLRITKPSRQRLLYSPARNLLVGPAQTHDHQVRKTSISLSACADHTGLGKSQTIPLSIDAVHWHIKTIYEKLKVHTQTETVSEAINERLV